MEKLVQGLYNKDNKEAYKAFQILEEQSHKNSEVYKFFDAFIDMMVAKNSYVRTRGLLLIAANAKWDTVNKIDEIIDDYLQHIVDEKPITARQFIKALPLVAKYKPELKDLILNALLKAHVSIYPDSMRSLVEKDIHNTIREIKEEE